jgi:hypothetical protein
MGQSQAEAANALELRHQDRVGYSIIPQKAHLEVFMKPGDNVGYQKGVMEHVTDSTITVGKEVLTIKEIESITVKRPTQVKSGAILGSIGIFLIGVAIVLEKLWLPVTISWIDYVFVIMLAGGIASLGTGLVIAALILLISATSHYVFKRFKVTAIHWKKPTKPRDSVPRIR